MQKFRIRSPISCFFIKLDQYTHMPSKKRKPQAKSSSWKPWGDHPRVVAISIISGLGGLVVGLISLWYTINNHSVQQATQTTKSTPSVSAPSSSVQQLPQPKSNRFHQFLILLKSYHPNQNLPSQPHLMSISNQ